MSVEIQHHDHEPIIFVTYSNPFNPSEDLHEANEATRTKINATNAPLIYRIEDISAIDMNFADVVEAMGAATENSKGSMRDDQVHGILIGKSQFSDIIEEGMKQDQYGGREIKMFATVDDALGYVNEHMKKNS